MDFICFIPKTILTTGLPWTIRSEYYEKRIRTHFAQRLKIYENLYENLTVSKSYYIISIREFISDRIGVFVCKNVFLPNHNKDFLP